MNTLQSRALNAQDLEHFHDEGYLMVPDVFDENDLQPVIDEISAEIDARASELVAQGTLSQSYAEEGFETRLAKISAETDKVALSIWNGALAGPGFFGLITNPKLLDVAEEICGPELIASSVYRLRPKIPNYNYGAVPWHQDSGYFEPYCDKSLVLTVWLPLVDATPERGCLWVMPRAHKGDVLRHTVDPKTGAYLFIPDEELPQHLQSVCVPVPKGGVLLMTNRTPHASYENSSDVVRWSMDLRYQSAALPTNAPISHLEGEMRHAPEAGIPLACYPPEADFLVRSRVRANEVMSDAESFRLLRTTHQSQPVADRWSATWTQPNAN